MKSSINLDEKARVDLRERVKELSCLYNVARLAARADIGIDGVFNGIAECLPPALLYPEKACARIVYDGRSYSTSGFRRGKHRQQVPIDINGVRRGHIEVTYPDEELKSDSNPFLDEEQNLLETLAQEVAALIMKREAQRDKLRLEEQLRHAPPLFS